jgi:transcriptional regulator with XRE-family HTH domain
MTELGKRIADLRKKEGLTQSELARKINLSHTQITRYELKDVQPPADILKKIADIFGTSIDYIVNGTAQEKAQRTLTDAELIKQFKAMEQLPETEKNTILNVVSAFIRDFKTKQAYLI